MSDFDQDFEDEEADEAKVRISNPMEEWVKGIAREAATEALQEFDLRSPYRSTFATLTITFAEGSEPQALSIPYQPYGNRTDISIPYRLVPVDGKVPA